MGQNTEFAELDDCVIRALQLAARGEVESAVARLERFLHGPNPETSWELQNAVYLHQGLLLEEGGAFSAALGKFAHIREKDVFSSVSRALHMARIQARLGQIEEAHRTLAECGLSAEALARVPQSRQFLLRGLLKDLPLSVRPFAAALMETPASEPQIESVVTAQSGPTGPAVRTNSTPV